MKNLLILSIFLILPACQCGIKIESKPSAPAITPASQLPSAGITDPDPKVQAVLDKFTPEEINQMFLDIPISDHRPETERNFDLLSKAMMAIERSKGNPRLQKADRVNEALRGL